MQIYHECLHLYCTHTPGFYWKIFNVDFVTENNISAECIRTFLDDFLKF